MGDKANFIRDCVITVVSDDYESFDLILRQTRRLAARRRTTVSKGEVAEAIRSVIADGYANAYALSTRPPHSRKVEYTPDRLHELWFYVTPRGKRAAKGIPALKG